VLISPQGRKYEFSLPIVATSTNNQAEYQALIKGLALLKEVHADVVEIFRDSMLVINQLAESYECRSEVLITYNEKSMQLLREFKDFLLEMFLGYIMRRLIGWLNMPQGINPC